MPFRTSLLMSATAAVMISGAAFAADLPSRTNAPAPLTPYLAPTPVFTWTGFYVGVNAGAAFGNNDNGGVTPYGLGTPTAHVSSGSTNTTFTGGGQIGYNWQSGAFVYGLEADFDYLGNNGAGVSSVGATPYFVALNGGNDDFLGTVRGRLGYAVDRALFYVTGGLAYGSGGGGGSVNYYPTSGGPYAYTSSGNNWNVGYALGGGVEYALTQNWSARIEYLYVDRSNKTTYSAPSGAPLGSYFSATNPEKDNVVRVGLNYKF